MDFCSTCQNCWFVMHLTYMKQMNSEQVTYIATAVHYLMKSRLLLERDFKVSSLYIITVFRHPNDSFNVSWFWTLVLVLQPRKVIFRKVCNWPAGCSDKVPLGPGWGNTLPQPAAPGSPADLWVKRQCHPSGSKGCCQSVSHCGQSGSNLKKSIRC